MKINRLLFVGAFPKNSKIYGGNVTACNALMKSEFPNNIDVIKIDSTQSSHPLPNFFVRLFKALKRLNLFFLILKEDKVDCVLIFAAWGFSLFEKGVMARMAHFFNKPVLFFPRGGHLVENFHESFFARILTKFALNKSTKILCQGEAIKEIAIKNLHFNHENTPIIRNWTASKDLLEIGKKKKVKKGPSLNFIFVGWLDFEKGIGEILEAFNKLSATYPVTLDLIGEGNARQFTEKYIKKNSLNNVKIHGWVDSEEINSFYKKADVLLLPSWLEGFPNVIVESMASKVFVISTNVGNISDAIFHEKTGFLVKKKNPEDLFLKMKRSIEKDSLREICLDNAFKYAEENFSSAKASKEIIKQINNSILSYNNESFG